MMQTNEGVGKGDPPPVAQRLTTDVLLKHLKSGIEFIWQVKYIMYR